MNSSVDFPSKKEYNVTVDNLFFKLLVDTSKGGYTYDKFVNSMHTHSHIELFVCIYGTILITTPDGVITLEESDVAVVPSDYPHSRISGENDNACKWCCINIAFSKKHNRDCFDLYSTFERFFDCKKVSIIKNKEYFCREIYDIYLNATANDSSISALRAVSVISRLCEDVFSLNKYDSMESPRNQGVDTDISLLYKLNHIINTCFMKDFTNSQIAEMLFISERHLSRIALKHYGMSIRAAIINKRLSAAEMLLADPDETIDSIVSAVGFNSNSGFYREFRKKYGITPNEYRKKHFNI